MSIFLVVGATGNTGGGVIQTLSSSLSSSKLFSSYRIMGLTRDKNGPTAKKLSSLPGVEMVEKDWTSINSEWLKENQVERVFIASHNGPSHFTDESLFYFHALKAGVKYVVRISTTKSNIAPDSTVFYARNHWAIETLLETPQYDAIQWTSLQPNVFTAYISQTAEAWVKTYREKGEKTPYHFMMDGDAPVAVIDPVEVGIAAGHLLLQEDTTPHNNQKYVLAGPSDLNGKKVVALIEKYAKTSVDDVTYRAASVIAAYAQGSGLSENLAASLSTAPASGYNGACSVEHEPTSPALAKLYTPKNHALEDIEKSLAGI